MTTTASEDPSTTVLHAIRMKGTDIVIPYTTEGSKRAAETVARRYYGEFEYVQRSVSPWEVVSA